MSLFNLGLNITGFLLSTDNYQIYPTDTKKYGKDFDSKYGFANISIMNVETAEESKIMESPIEDGRLIADSKIIMPKVAEVTIALPSALGDDYLSFGGGLLDFPTKAYEKVIAGLKRIFNENIAFSIKTKTDVFDNMYLERIPKSFSIDNNYRCIVTLIFKEAIIISSDTDIKTDLPDDGILANIGSKLKENFSGVTSKLGF